MLIPLEVHAERLSGFTFNCLVASVKGHTQKQKVQLRRRDMVLHSIRVRNITMGAVEFCVSPSC